MRNLKYKRLCVCTVYACTCTHYVHERTERDWKIVIDRMQFQFYSECTKNKNYCDWFSELKEMFIDTSADKSWKQINFLALQNGRKSKFDLSKAKNSISIWFLVNVSPHSKYVVIFREDDGQGHTRSRYLLLYRIIRVCNYHSVIGFRFQFIHFSVHFSWYQRLFE